MKELEINVAKAATWYCCAQMLDVGYMERWDWCILTGLWETMAWTDKEDMWDEI